MHWIDSPTTGRGILFGTHRFVVLLRRAGEPTDVWLGRARLSPEGRLLGLSSIHNLSDTSAVEEASLLASGEQVAWAVKSEAEVVAIQVADLRGRSLTASGLTWLERLQTRITFLQETGQVAGICRRAYRWKSPPVDLTLAWTSGGLRVDAGGTTAVLGCENASIQGLTLVAEPSELGNPGDLVTWTVDRVRAWSWFGSDRMQWVKAVAFQALERLDAAKRRVVRSNPTAPTVDEVGDFLSKAVTNAPDPLLGWPPRAMTPIISPHLADEGVYRPLDDDAFAVPPEGGPSPFAFGYVRPDPTRDETRVFVTIWDPRRLELHTMTGTREPKTATGETGAGTVPRDDATIGRLAAAFNGGFQATHGEFGMMAQNVVYLPPKPYAATIAEFADGTTGFGTWPNDEAIPDGIVGFRQNLTPLISDGKVNAYGRTWWGGVPPGWHDATRTVRTGLCLTDDDFAAYFYGSTISADHLAKAMVSAHCRYGIHLDMNPGHTGFEFYRVGPSSTLPQLRRKLDASWEARGVVSGTSGYEFIGRRMLKTMHLMHFPRYIRTDSRDFFYLTHRHALPPASVAPRVQGAATGSQPWQTKEHRQLGYPPAIASQRLHPDRDRPELEVAVVALDAKWTAACRSNCATKSVVARIGRMPRASGLALYQHERRYFVTATQPPNGAVLVASGKDESHLSKAAAALGVAHRDWLFYAEVTRGADRLRDVKTLRKVLVDLGCSEIIYLEQSLDLSMGDPGHEAAYRDGLVITRDESPMAKRMFVDTPLVPPTVWQPLQNKRVRYVRKRPAEPERPSAQSAAPGDRAEEAPATHDSASPTRQDGAPAPP